VTLSRRTLLASALAATSPPTFAKTQANRLRILVTGGHPGDPECGCAGTIARYVALGHEVTLLYLNRGEGFCKIPGNNAPSSDDCAAVRSAEAEKACQILHAKPVFAGQVDGRAIVDNSHYQDFAKLFAAQNADVVFAQWPIDNHRDHRALSQLVLDAWLGSHKKAAFYYYEVADDTMMFSPAEYVDISSPDVESLRRAACFAHASQQPEKWFPHQVELTRFRGSQSGHPQAEGFLRHWESRAGVLP
jgi:LmbE family N-acetylglucosaminyl deacetylase